jgi:hypothetical protein
MFRTRFFFAVVAVLAVVASAGMAQSTNSNAASSRRAITAEDRKASSFTPLALRQLQQNPKLRGQYRSPAQAQSLAHWRSPYEQFLKPVTDRMIARAHTAGLPTKLAGVQANTRSAAQVATSSGIAANFPGFQLSPMVKGNNPADPNTTFISLTADVNKDGKPDLITVQNDGTVNVLINPGTGKFTDWAVTSTNTTAVNDIVYDVYATVADLNGDGYPDLEVMDGQNNREYIYINKKDGVFNDPVYTTITYSTGAQFYGNAGTVLFTDVNGDGIPDMVATVPYGYFTDTFQPASIVSILVFLGKGDGTFNAPLPEQTSNFNGYLFNEFGNLVAADMNNDGKIDLVYMVAGNDVNFNTTSFVTVVLGNGDGTFASFPSDFPTTGPVLPGVANNTYGSIAVSDVNGDGMPDVLFSLGEGSLYTALGSGNGQLQNAQTVATGLSTDLITGPQMVNFADVDGDGILDAIAYNWGFIAIYKGTGGGNFNNTPLEQFVSGEGGDQQPMPADFNGDGHVDIVEVDYDEARIDFYAGGDWAHAGAPAMSAPGDSAQTFQVMAIGDFNGDGVPDVVAADFNGVAINPNGGDDGVKSDLSYTPPTQTLGVNGTYPDIKVGINDGKGNFTYTTILSQNDEFPLGVSWIEPVAADLNKDGKADIILGDFHGLAISLNKGDGAFAAPVQVDLNVSYLPCGIAYVDVGDLNGDGAPDIVAAYPGDASCNAYTQVTPSGVFILLNNGKGAFTSTFMAYGYGAYLPKLADLNGDGNLDLVLADINDAQLDYFLYAIPGNGDGTFNLAGATLPLENTVVTAIIPGDYNGDGKMDLALGVETQVDGNGNPIYNTTGVNLLTGNGDFTFGLAVQYSAGIYPIAGASADFNGDGLPDLALNMLTFNYYTDIQTSSFVYMANLGGGAFGPAVQTAAPVGAPGPVLVADINNDGAIDALVGGWVLGFSGVSELYLNSGAIRMSLASSAASVPQDSTVTLTATLSPSVSAATPTGTITFYDNGSVLSILPVAGTATTLTLANLPIGNNAITAKYSGDSDFNAASSSAATTITVAALAPTFALSTPAPASLTLQRGATGEVLLTLTGNATFNGTVEVACSGAPAEASCTVNPGSVKLTGAQSATVSVTVATTPPNNTYEAANQLPTWMKNSGGISLAGVLLLFWRGRRKMRSSLWTAVLLLLVGAGAAVSLSGCGGGDKFSGTPIGSATLTVTATSSSLTQTATLTVNITK